MVTRATILRAVRIARRLGRVRRARVRVMVRLNLRVMVIFLIITKNSKEVTTTIFKVARTRRVSLPERILSLISDGTTQLLAMLATVTITVTVKSSLEDVSCARIPTMIMTMVTLPVKIKKLDVVDAVSWSLCVMIAEARFGYGERMSMSALLIMIMMIVLNCTNHVEIENLIFTVVVLRNSASMKGTKSNIVN